MTTLVHRTIILAEQEAGQTYPVRTNASDDPDLSLSVGPEIEERHVRNVLNIWGFQDVLKPTSTANDDCNVTELAVLDRLSQEGTIIVEERCSTSPFDLSLRFLPVIQAEEPLTEEISDAEDPDKYTGASEEEEELDETMEVLDEAEDQLEEWRLWHDLKSSFSESHAEEASKLVKKVAIARQGVYLLIFQMMSKGLYICYRLFYAIDGGGEEKKTKESSKAEKGQNTSKTCQESGDYRG